MLYLVIAVSFGYVFYKALQGTLSYWIALPFALNLLCNALFTPLQFGLRSNVLAAVDILLVLATLLWALILIYPYYKWVALVNIPYLIWVCFATALQLTITYLNW